MKHQNQLNVAIHIMAYAYLRRDSKLSSNLIADSLNVSAVTVRQTTSLLSKAGLINTQAGSGKITLNAEPKEISIHKIYLAVTDAELFYRHTSTSMTCPIGIRMPSALDNIYRDIEQTVYDKMDTITLQDVIDELMKQ